MSNDDLNSDSYWVKELKNHNKKVFRTVFDTYRHDVYAYSLSLLKQKEYAEEIVQEVFLKVWLNRESLDHRYSFKSYIFTITRNLTLNFLRKAAYDNKLREEIFYYKQKHYNSVELSIQDREFEDIKQQVIELLPPRRKSIFVKARFEGKTYKDISGEMGISVSTVKNQMSKALETIRDFLRVHEDITITMVVLLVRVF